ncbi:MAG: tRNA (adenosine(37)-N6)-dimethylallyltransferase MiaA [Pseudomonadota bacterium]|nr:tRNA (adenosine(37)-N6)-dimethylallyltransferase MiaA [Pseudomonadota bacterium]
MDKVVDYISVLGPTAFGKTQMLLDLAHDFPDKFEIISVDSVQVYRGLDIGSAKPSFVERQLVPHHLIDCVDVDQPYSAYDFCEQAKLAIQSIKSRGKVPILSGGTMMYYHAFENGIAPIPSISDDAKEQVHLVLLKGELHAWNLLGKVDPKAALRIKSTDRQRIQRALEVFFASGKPITYWQQKTKRIHDFYGKQMVLYPEDRQFFHNRIALRFQKMLDDGLVAELDALRIKYKENLDINKSSIRSIGYRQVWEYLHGRLSYDAMRDKAITATRRYLKRQCTWLKKWPDAHARFNNVSDCFQVITSVLSSLR